MQNFNYHTHTYRCGHADDTMRDEDFVKELINKGFKKIAFTDHAPNKDGIDDRRYMRMKYSATQQVMLTRKLRSSLRLRFRRVI